MVRHKPRAVQRERQQRKRQLQALEEGGEAAAGGGTNAVGDGEARQKKKRKHGGVSASPTGQCSARHALQQVDGVCVNATGRPLKLTLDASQCGNDSEGWEDALWFSLPVQPVRCDRELNGSGNGTDPAPQVDGVAVSDAFVDTVTCVLSQEESDDDEGNPLQQSRCRLGLEMGPTAGHLTLISCNTQKKTETSLTSVDAFPGAYPMWLAHVLGLVERELLTLELELIDDDEAKTLVWRVGVAWRKYVQHCYGLKRSRKQVQPPVMTLPRVELHASVHRVMLWVLKHSRSPCALRLFGERCAFPYWDELELLYHRFVGDNATKASKIGQSATGAVSDLYARIDTRRQLERSVDNFDAAIERVSEQYRKTSGDGEDDLESGRSVLVPTLRPYQKAAVSWMLERERRLDDRISTEKNVNSATIDLNVTFPGATNAPEVRQHVTYDPYCAAFVNWRDDSVPTDGYTRQYDMSTVCGGILADEMGLGKTVEVISLVLSHVNPASLPVLQYAGSSSVDAEEAAQVDIEEPEADEAMDMDCICGIDDPHELGVVKCDLCETWHHQICSGFAPTSSSSRGVWTFDCAASKEREPFAFMCFHCQIRERPWFSSKTTLIVSPESIHDQWEAELKRHVRSRDAVSLLRYPGVKALRSRLRSGPSAEWQVLSTAGLRLATYDIVLTTYEALRTDLHHLPTPAGRDRRASTRQTRKKYAFMASPLVFLEFWRVCMDEAQVGVESTTAQTALTIAQLRARSTWVVTGTPFSKSSSVSDLFGYLKFLRIEPFASASESMFRDVVASAFSAGAIDRVLDLLFWNGKKMRGSDRQHDGGGLLWRTSKRDVLDQLHLPSQRSLVVWCRFSQVERHFYEQQERAIVSFVRQRERLRSQQQDPSSDRNDEDAVIDGRDRIWHDLLELRKICCHPQIGNAFGAINGAGVVALNGRRLVPTAVLTMDEFLRELISRNKRECEEAQRKLVVARNGLAAMRLLSSSDAVEVEEDEPAGAVAAIQEYLDAVQLIQTNWPLFRADLLPRLHILENLARLVRMHFGLGLPASEDARNEADSVDNTSSSDSSITVNDREKDSDGEQHNSRAGADGESGSWHRNPKQYHLLPLLPVLTRQLAVVTSHDITPASITPRETRNALDQECAQLEKSASSIRQFYLLQVENAHGLAKSNFETLEAKIAAQIETRSRASSTSEALLCSSSMWWNDALTIIERADAGEQADRLVARIHARLAAFGTKWATRFCAQLVSARTLRLQLVTELEALAKRRRALFNALKAMSVGTPSREEVQRSGNCCKCRDAGNGPVCAHCKLYKELDAYRQHVLGIDSSASSSSLSAMLNAGGGSHARLADIFDGEEEEGEEEEDHQASTASSGTAASSLLVEVFKEIAASARAFSKHAWSSSSSSLADMSTHLQGEVELFGLLLREWNAAKKLFQTQHQRLGALDELEMASSQIRLRLEGEAVKTAAEKLYIIDAFAVPTRLAELEADRAIADRELRDALAQLRFLLQLADEQHKAVESIALTNGDGSSMSSATTASAEGGESASSSRRECAVCLQEMDGSATTATRAMLLCAHAFCRSCVETLAKRRRGMSVKCPTCRRVTPADRVAIVAQGHNDTCPSQQPQQQIQAPSGNGRPGAGSGFGSKMDALLRCVRALVERDPDVKFLLFSQWHGMLSIVSEYLRVHVDGVSCFVYSTKRAFPTLLRDFKACPRACVLALPYSIGANGLNIVEATEVLLVEPLLNASTEAQAINRVHRIGQTRPTNVHRFIVEATVEERIHWLGKTRHHLARARLGASSSGDVSGEANNSTTATSGSSNANDRSAEGEKEDGDDDDTTGAAGGRQAKREKLTMRDLHVLLNGKTANQHTGGQNDATASLHTFWHEEVMLNGRPTRRETALQFLERRHALDMRAGQYDQTDTDERERASASTDTEPTTRLFDRDVRLRVANELLALPSASDGEQATPGDGSNSVHDDLVALHRTRVKEELATWVSAIPRSITVE